MDLPVARKLLTAAAVRRFRPDPSGQRREIYDGGAPGLRLVVHPTGAKSWVMRFRRPDGETSAKLTLGTVDISGFESEADPVIGGHLTLAAARRLAAEVARQRALGRDVVADYAAERTRRRVAAVERAQTVFGGAARSFVENHARPKTRRWRETASLLGLRPAGDELAVIRGGLADRWADKPIADITVDDVHALIDEVSRRGVPGLQKRCAGPSESRPRALFACLSKFFSWLIANRLVERNPCVGVARPGAPRPRERVLSDREIRLFWKGCDLLGEPFGPLLKLLLITGQRLNEVARMTRGELGEDEASRPVWTLPAARTKNKRLHVVPLSPLAHEILSGMHQIASERGYVFTTTGATPVSGFSKIKRRLDELMLTAAQEANDAAAVAPWRFHDLRRTAVSGMARAGADLHVIERAVNHVSGSFGGIVSTYQRHRFADEVRSALEGWAKLLGQVTTDLPHRPRDRAAHGNAARAAKI